MGDVFNDWKKAAQAKRKSNRDSSAQVLLDAGIKFESRNNGAHLIVGGDWDFWPGTGKFHSRTTPTKGRGVRNLLRELVPPRTSAPQ